MRCLNEKRETYWQCDVILSLNIRKIKEVIIKIRTTHADHIPLTINVTAVEKVTSTKTKHLLELTYDSILQESTTASPLSA